MSVTHIKVSSVPDGANPSEVQPSDWNAAHTISGTANTVAKFTGTDLVPSSLTDNGSQLICSLPGVTDAQFGQKMSVVLNGPLGLLLTSTGSDGFDTQIVAKYTAVGHQGEIINYNSFLQGTVDTTPAPIQAIGSQITVTPSKSAGSNTVTNIGVMVNVANGDTNYGMWIAAGDIRVDGGAQFKATIVDSLTIGTAGGAVDLTTSSAVTLGSHVGNFVLPGSAAATASIGVGGTVSDGTQLQCKNTVAASAFNGIDILGDTTVNAAINPGVYIYRGAGGGAGGSVEGCIVMSGSAGGFIAGSAVNDLIIQNQTSGKRILFSADGTGFTLGASLDGTGNWTTKASVLAGGYHSVGTETLIAAGAASIALGATFVSGAASNLTLANGTTDGQTKTFTATSGTGQVTPAAFGNGTKMTWSAGGQSCTLMWGAASAKWWLVANVGMTVV